MKLQLPPLSLVATILITLAAGAFIALAWLQVIPLTDVFFYILNNVLSFVAVALLAAIGGIFLGMVLAHRALATREFSPVERAMMEASQEIKHLTTRLDQLEGTLLARLDRLEEREREARMKR